MNLNLHCAAELRYKVEFLRDGVPFRRTKWRRNMITDTGLDTIGTGVSWLNCILSPIIGTNVSPNPVRRDSGAITFTQAGTALTASSGFFVATDTGRLFKWGTGSAGAEFYLTYVDSTHATASASATVATPTIGTVWYVNTAALLTPIAALTWNADPGAANNYSNFSVAGSVVTITSQTVRISSAMLAPATITEIAFNNSTTNANVFDRDIVSPTVALLTGDQARVTVQLIRTLSPVTPAATVNVGTGCDTTGQMQIEALIHTNGETVSTFAASGGVLVSGGAPLEGGMASVYIMAITGGAVSFQSFSDVAATSRTGTLRLMTAAGYGTGNRYRDYSVTFTIAQVVGTIYGLALAASSSDGLVGSLQNYLTWKFTTPATKLGTQTMAVTLRKSWSRVLTN